jgi:hypothetical protein
MADDDSRTPVDAGTRTEPVVLNFGGAPTPPAGPPRRWSGSAAQLTQRLRAAASGHRTPPGTGRTASLTLAALGALAGAGSAGSAWIEYGIPGLTIDGDGQYVATMSVADLGGYGTTYLLGFFALLVGAALALFGSPGIRRDARIAVLALGGGLLVLLIVVAGNADGWVRSTLRIGPDLIVQTGTGTGLNVGYLGVGALLTAVYLAGRAYSPDDTGSDTGLGAEPATPTGPAPGDGPVPDAGPLLDPGAEPGTDLRPPADLTVAPTDPFVRPDQPPYQNRRW